MEGVHTSGSTRDKPSPDTHQQSFLKMEDLSFDDFYRNVGHKIATDHAGLEHFSQLQTDEERVAYLLPKIQESAERAAASLTSRCSKDSTYAEQCLESATMALSYDDNINLARALTLCSDAVRFAPVLSSVFTRALATRSGILFKLNFYEEALKDWDLVESETTHDPTAKYKIALGRASCLAWLEEWDIANNVQLEALKSLRNDHLPKEQMVSFAVQFTSQIKSFRTHRMDTSIKGEPSLIADAIPTCPPLMSTPHKSIPNACDAMELRVTPEKGRHLIATKTIQPGSVLMVDEPYAWMLRPSSWPGHCSYCCRPVLSAVPCLLCNSVCFCDAACRDNAWNTFHCWECGILGHFSSSKDLSPMALLVLRIVARAGLATLSQPNSDYVYNKAYLQEANTSKRPVGDLIKRTMTAIFLEKCLERTGFCTPVHCVLVAAALLRHSQSCSCNAYEITEYVPTLERGDDVAIGGAMYTSISLANHSCNNNVVRHSYGRRCVVRTLTTIHEGEEILDNYGYSFLSCPKQERQLYLNRQYFFVCDCNACINNWPIFTELPEKSLYKCSKCKRSLNRLACSECYSKREIKNIESEIKSCLSKYNNAIQKISEKKYEDSVTLLCDNIKILSTCMIHPSKELVKCQQALLKCWSLCANVNMILLQFMKIGNG